MIAAAIAAVAGVVVAVIQFGRRRAPEELAKRALAPQVDFLAYLQKELDEERAARLAAERKAARLQVENESYRRREGQ